MNPTAFDPYQLGAIQLRNRIVMCPMTRTRSPQTIPDDHVVRYYAQRASAGLIITEGTQPSVEGQGIEDTPGLHSQKQVAAWRNVTGAVHTEGGRIFAQLMHVGRIGAPHLLPGEHRLLAPSAVPAEGRHRLRSGPVSFSTPKEMSREEIHYVIDSFRTAAANAITAGFDGVEVHGANGYLVHQFLSSNANLRTDEWGCDNNGRVRFAVEVVKAVSNEIGSDRVGLRISPQTPLHDITEHDPQSLYMALLDGLDPLQIAYLHISESEGTRPLIQKLASRWKTSLILNPHTVERPTDERELPLLEEKSDADGMRLADLLAFGANFISNPDLPYRLQHSLPLQGNDPTTSYGVGPRGYTDYPVISQSQPFLVPRR